jgi:hypothetical protein
LEETGGEEVGQPFGSWQLAQFKIYLPVYGRKEEEEGGSLRRSGTEAETAGTACYNGNFAIEGKERGEVVELCFGHGEKGWRVLATTKCNGKVAGH